MREQWQIWDQPYLNFNERCDYYQEQIKQRKRDQAHAVGVLLAYTFFVGFWVSSVAMSRNPWLWIPIPIGILLVAYSGLTWLRRIRFGLNDWRKAFREAHGVLDQINGRNF